MQTFGKRCYDGFWMWDCVLRPYQESHVVASFTRRPWPSWLLGGNFVELMTVTIIASIEMHQVDEL